MKHDYNTIFTLTQTATGKSVYCTEEYANFYGLEETPRQKSGEPKVALKIRRHGTFSGTDKLKVYDIEGVRTVYVFGAYLWFDTEEERNAHKEQARIEREKEIERNKVKKAIIEKLDRMSKADLEKILKNLWKTLDKKEQMCYNNYGGRETPQILNREVNTMFDFTNLETFDYIAYEEMLAEAGEESAQWLSCK